MRHSERHYSLVNSPAIIEGILACSFIAESAIMAFSRARSLRNQDFNIAFVGSDLYFFLLPKTRHICKAEKMRDNRCFNRGQILAENRADVRHDSCRMQHSRTLKNQFVCSYGQAKDWCGDYLLKHRLNSSPVEFLVVAPSGVFADRLRQSGEYFIQLVRPPAQPCTNCAS